MSNEEIRVGDVVELKSGSPLMTVSKVVSSDIYCIWFADENTEKRSNFPKESLKKVR